MSLFHALSLKGVGDRLAWAILKWQVAINLEKKVSQREVYSNTKCLPYIVIII